MKKQLKRLTAALSTLVLLIMTVTPTFAGTFNDVKEEDWYFNYVEELVGKKIIEPGEKYLPDEPIKRGELARMVVKAIDGLIDYAAPHSPSFSDVPKESPFFDYVEAAAQLGIINGYADSNGNLTGKFGPEDLVNRATATKILIESFDIAMSLEKEIIFPDVSSSDWYYEYVTTAYNHSILQGYENGFFGAADPVTRAQIAKLIVNAQGKTMETSSKSTSENDASQTMLEVSLNDYPAPEATVPLASTATIFHIDFTAAGGDTHVSEVTLSRGGVGLATDWFAIYAYDGNFKITSEYTVNSSTNRVRVPLNLFIEAGQTETISFYGDTDVIAVPASQHYFYIDSAADIISSADTLSGDFPINSNTIKIGSLFANTILVTPGPTLSKPERDRHSKISTFNLEAGNSSEVAISIVALTQAGSFDSSKMTDCRLLRENNFVAEADGFYGEKLIFVLEEPYIIKEGDNKNFYVRCYIDGGKTTDTIQLYLDEIYDLIATDLDFGYAAAPINFFGRDLAPIYNLRGAKIIISD